MPRMIDLIRASAVPSNLVQSAAKGALSIPGPEMVEILVYLAGHNEVFGDQARMTLAGWNQESARTIAADPNTPKEILDYLASPANLRPALLPALLSNSAVSEAVLVELAASVPAADLDFMLQTSRVKGSPVILKALHSNPNLSAVDAAQVRAKLVEGGWDPGPQEASGAEDENVLDGEITVYLDEHAAEITANEKPFQPIGGMHESLLDSPEPEPEPEAAAAVAAARGGPPEAGAATKRAPIQRRGSVLQKIGTLDVKGRIQLAMKGSKEERSILVRDGTKVVALAVLESPKVTDSEVEKFAGQKNVLESLLRGITMKRRFMKNYNIVRNLVANPRTPLDVALPLMKNILVNDLKSLSGNKDVSETIRKLALKMFKQKKDASNKK